MVTGAQWPIPPRRAVTWGTGEERRRRDDLLDLDCGGYASRRARGHGAFQLHHVLRFSAAAYMSEATWERLLPDFASLLASTRAPSCTAGVLLALHHGAGDVPARKTAAGQIGVRQARELLIAVVHGAAVANAGQHVGEVPRNTRLAGRRGDDGAVGERVELQHRDPPVAARHGRVE